MPLPAFDRQVHVVAAPYPPEMLLERAELAGHAMVLSRADGRAKLRFTRLIKGRPRVNGLFGKVGLYRVATVAYRSQPAEPRLGDWWDQDCFVPGNRILTHLRWNDRLECYEAVWWNATEIIERPS